MNESTRRKFLHDVSVGLGSAAIAVSPPISAGVSSVAKTQAEDQNSNLGFQTTATVIDFRYSPLSWQTVYCFPDDLYKSLVGDHGDLRYWNPGRPAGAQYFPQIVEFSLLGMESDQVGRSAWNLRAFPSFTRASTAPKLSWRSPLLPPAAPAKGALTT